MSRLPDLSGYSVLDRGPQSLDLTSNQACNDFARYARLIDRQIHEGAA
jgi:hypothetical protein